MKHLRLLIFSSLTLVLLSTGALAQKKTTKKPVAKKPTTSATVPPLDVRAAREKTSVQHDNLDQFIAVLGPIAQNIEEITATSKTKTLPKATLDKNEANKQKVVAAIRNMKDGLSNLETEFRTKPLLQKYLPSIQGITDLASQSEDMAIAGKFVASKDPLRDAAQKLADTLAVLPK